MSDGINEGEVPPSGEIPRDNQIDLYLPTHMDFVYFFFCFFATSSSKRSFYTRFGPFNREYEIKLNNSIFDS